MKMVGSKHDKKRLVINTEKCIGCDACTNVCQPGLIATTDTGSQRILRFPIICNEDCTRCADVCPEGAVAFTPAPDVLPAEEYLTVTFDLLPCERCGNLFTTRRIVDKLLAALPREIGADPEELPWLRLCPICRQALEGENVVSEKISVSDHLKR
jgi:hydrogenase-4 component H